MSISAWAPGHATLFFAVPKKYSNPEKMGSLGAGINLESGVKTTLQKSNVDQIYWNNNRINGKVSFVALKLLRDHIKKFDSVRIIHQSELPMGYGLSTSGAGALGTLLVANEFYQAGLSDDELFRIAHNAEVINHTGLGSVVGQIASGIEIRIKQGGPSYGKVLSIPSEQQIILAFYGPLSTSDVLTSKKQVDQVTKFGLKAIDKVKLSSTISLSMLIKLGQEFMDKCGLKTPIIQKARDQLREFGEELVTMAMIGETLVIKPNNPLAVVKWLENNNVAYCNTHITTKKPHLIL